MDWIWLLRQPWFDVSPNIVAMSWYVLCGIVGGRILLAHGSRYKRWPKLTAFTDGLFLIGIIVGIQDTGWLVMSSLKWYAGFHELMSFQGYWIRYPQNLVGLCLLFLLTWGVWKAKMARFTRTTTFWMFILLLFMGINFMLAPDPSWTDYTYAVRMGAPDWQIFLGFSLYLFVKGLMSLAFLGLFREETEPSSSMQFHSAYKGMAGILSSVGRLKASRGERLNGAIELESHRGGGSFADQKEKTSLNMQPVDPNSLEKPAEGNLAHTISIALLPEESAHARVYIPKC